MRCYSTRTESLKYNISFLFNIPFFEKKNAEISLQQNFVYLEPQNMFPAYPQNTQHFRIWFSYLVNFAHYYRRRNKKKPLKSNKLSRNLSITCDNVHCQYADLDL